MAKEKSPAESEDDQGRGPSEFPDVAALSYEAARDELVSIVARLEAGQAGLEESMTLWRRGEALASHCAGWLERAEATLAESAEPQAG